MGRRTVSNQCARGTVERPIGLNWWRHVEPRPGMWRALDGLPRYIATPCVSKHRLFAWRDVRICPDHKLIVVARDDDTTFGILHQPISRDLVPSARLVARQRQ